MAAAAQRERPSQKTVQWLVPWAASPLTDGQDARAVALGMLQQSQASEQLAVPERKMSA
jgi:hypothetical protein